MYHIVKLMSTAWTYEGNGDSLKAFKDMLGVDAAFCFVVI